MKDRLKLFEDFEEGEEKKEPTDAEIDSFMKKASWTNISNALIHIFEEKNVNSEAFTQEYNSSEQKYPDLRKRRNEILQKFRFSSGTTTSGMTNYTFGPNIYIQLVYKSNRNTSIDTNLLTVSGIRTNGDIYLYVGSVEELWRRVYDKIWKLERREVHKNFGF